MLVGCYPDYRIVEQGAPSGTGGDGAAGAGGGPIVVGGAPNLGMPRNFDEVSSLASTSMFGGPMEWVADGASEPLGAVKVSARSAESNPVFGALVSPPIDMTNRVYKARVKASDAFKGKVWMSSNGLSGATWADAGEVWLSTEWSEVSFGAAQPNWVGERWDPTLVTHFGIQSYGPEIWIDAMWIENVPAAE
jgi:hypothetical protein